MTRSLFRLLLGSSLLVALLGVTGSPAFAQGSGTSLSGVVVDSDGGVIPGASVVVKNLATNVTYDAVSNETGVFSLPAISNGTYSVTVSLMGFKTSVLPEVRVTTGVRSDVKVTLQIGQLTESVTVTANAEVIQTQGTAITQTISAEQIRSLPLVARNAVNFLAMLPGAATTGTVRAGAINGLPGSSMAITIDGVNTEDNSSSGETFFSRITPNVDAIESVTVSSSTATAGDSGQGAVQVRFTTRSGTNTFTGSAYEYYRNPKLNSNYWFNQRDGLAKDDIRLNQPGFRVGGPIRIPGVFDGRNKAFFFFNYEELRLPSAAPRTRTVINQDAQAGLFRYGTSGAVNVLALAAANGQLATTDPTVIGLLNQIRASTTTTGVIQGTTDPNTLAYVYQATSTQLRRFPTGSVNINLSKRHTLKSTMYYQRYDGTPDLLNNAEARFNGLGIGTGQNSDRWQQSNVLRSTLSANLVNEVTVGGSWGKSFFSAGNTRDNYSYMNGYNLALGFGLTSPGAGTGQQTRTNPTLEVADALSWLRGSHSFTMGFQYSRIDAWTKDETLAPGVTLGLHNTDPAFALFSTTNLPGAATTDLTSARALYALLTGRVTTVTGNIRLDENTGQYVYLGPGIQRGRLHDLGSYIQDSWRARPNFTVNVGLRYELQLPYESRNNSYSAVPYNDIFGVSGPGNIFKPGVLQGQSPMYVAFGNGVKAYNTDLNNFAPNVGVTWRPNVQSGFLRTLLGKPEETVIRGGFGISYDRGGTADFTGIIGANPGASKTTTRSLDAGSLSAAGETLPVLLSQTGRLGAPSFNATPTYPFAPQAGRVESLNIFNPDIQVPSVHSYSIGIQRALSNTTAVEVRYVGNRRIGGWATDNYNERNIFENGFLNEFKLAQANFEANKAASRGNTFAYFGPGTGTSPLPIYLGFLTGSSASGTPTAYTASQFTNTTFVNRLASLNPSPTNAAGDLDGTAAFRTNGVSAGFPVNFFVMNPDVSSANIRTNGGDTTYDSMQVELRRRLSGGLLVSANYTLMKQRFETRDSTLRREYFFIDDTEGPHHALKFNWVYDLPFGRGRHFAANSGRLLDTVVGGWQFSGNARVQSGTILNFGGFRLVGMTDEELRDVYKLQFRNNTAGVYTPYMLPADILENTIKAFSTSATSATGYGALGAPTGRYFAPASGPDCIQIYAGDCTPRNRLVTGPVFSRFDMTLAKNVKLAGRVGAEFRFEVFNVFNVVNFNPVAGASSSTSLGQITSGYRDTNNTFDPGSRISQLVFRLNW